MNGHSTDETPGGPTAPADSPAPLRSRSSSGHRRSSRQRRREKKRKREKRRIFLAIGFVLTELLGFSLANFAPKNSWAELGGFLLLQPVQIVLNGLDAHFQLTRGLRDDDAVLLVTLLSLPLNLFLWYGVWRGWRAMRRKHRRRRYAPGGTHGPSLPARRSSSRSPASYGGDRAARAATSSDLRQSAADTIPTGTGSHATLPK